MVKKISIDNMMRLSRLMGTCYRLGLLSKPR